MCTPFVGFISETLVCPPTGVKSRAVDFQSTRDLKSQDSIVYASVIADLEVHTGEDSCFVTKDRSDFFSNQDIQEELDGLACKLLGSFDDGLGYVRSHS